MGECRRKDDTRTCDRLGCLRHVLAGRVGLCATRAARACGGPGLLLICGGAQNSGAKERLCSHLASSRCVELVHVRGQWRATEADDRFRADSEKLCKGVGGKPPADAHQALLLPAIAALLPCPARRGLQDLPVPLRGRGMIVLNERVSRGQQATCTTHSARMN